jgi:hypothetical protein
MLPQSLHFDMIFDSLSEESCRQKGTIEQEAKF